MSLLAPLYALAALAIGLPVLFHLIRRQPRGKMPFSSLMFLSASPPRLTRRSRLDNLLLLLLRGLAILLIAAAFARPFLRAASQAGRQPPGRNVLVLVDTSASMQREGFWAQALEEVDRLVATLQPTDRLEVAAFDDAYRTILSFDSPLPLEERRAAVRSALEGISPGPAGTDLGGALLAAADTLGQRNADPAASTSAGARLVLISDLQAGANVDRLQGYQWPADVVLDLRTVEPRRTANAVAMPLPMSTEEGEASDELRVRVRNAADSNTDQFQLFWAEGAAGGDEGDGGAGGDGAKSTAVQVPPGESRVVRIAMPGGETATLRLSGDAAAFDNERFWVRPRQRSRTLLFLGSQDEENPRASLVYYLRRAALDNLWQKVDVEVRDPSSPLTPPPVERVPLIVIAGSVPAASAATLADYARQGGRVLHVLTSAGGDPTGAEALVRAVSGGIPVRIAEAGSDDYAMLAGIDFEHPLFAPFADPRFNDFTKIRFWSHRRIEWDQEDAFRVLARFDDGTPALLERVIGDGRMMILAAGWQPQESQLALSSKFVPLVAGWFDPQGGRRGNAGDYEVGQTLPLEDLPADAEIMLPDGSHRRADALEGRLPLQQTGIYRIRAADSEMLVAVNLPRGESRTEPLDPQQLETFGVRLGATQTADELAAAESQLRDRELEGQQKLWRPLLIAALGALAFETLLGGWLVGRRRAPAETAA